MSNEQKTKISIANKGHKHTEQTRKKISETRKGKYGGSKNPAWKGGLCSINAKSREHVMASPEYKLWRKKIFERDKHICQYCFNQGGYLQAHHLISFQKYPKLRFVVNNGITLHRDCHWQLHRKTKGVSI